MIWRPFKEHSTYDHERLSRRQAAACTTCIIPTEALSIRAADLKQRQEYTAQRCELARIGWRQTALKALTANDWKEICRLRYRCRIFVFCMRYRICWDSTHWDGDRGAGLGTFHFFFFLLSTFLLLSFRCILRAIRFCGSGLSMRFPLSVWK